MSRPARKARSSRRPEKKEQSPVSPGQPKWLIWCGTAVAVGVVLSAVVLLPRLRAPERASALAQAEASLTRPESAPHPAGSGTTPGVSAALAPPPSPSGAPPPAVATTGPDAGYIGGTASCAECHGSIVDSYSKIAMGQSLYPPSPENSPEDYTTNSIYYHEPSRQYFQMVREGDKFYHDRWQKGPRGEQINKLRVSVDYVLGSGRHARSYVHMEKGGAAYQLPVAWYPQPGKWAMNPGYDNPHHQGFSRRITYDCAYCHAAKPKLPAGADYGNFPETSIFPHGLEAIDCERCHGPAAKHVELARAKAPAEQLKASIVNPANLSNKLQMDVCMSCHLETTSDKLPHSVLVEGKMVYEFKPGDDLNDHKIHLDHPKGVGYDDKFEIAGQAYRLRMSKCFTASEGQMSCTTCHDPHRVPKDRIAAGITSCQTCHDDGSCREAPEVRAIEQNNCITCHMPRRRTDDVVNVVMTDHFIQRHRPKRDLEAPLKENPAMYKGEVALYYPDKLEKSLSKLYLGIAQVYNGGDLPRAISMLNEYLGVNPNSFGALMAREVAMKSTGRYAEAVADLKKVIELKPHHPQAWMALGDAYERLERHQDAVYCYEQVVKLNPTIAPAHNRLGSNRLQLGDIAGAIAACTKAAELDPYDEDPHLNLASARGRLGEIAAAADHARRAMTINPAKATAWTLLARCMIDDATTTAARDAAWYAAEGMRLSPGKAEPFETLRDAVDILPPSEVVSSLEKFAADIPFEARVLKARALVMGGNGEAAGELLTDLADEVGQTSYALVLTTAGEIAAGVGRGDLAIALYRRALELEAQDAAARLGLAMALARRDIEGEAEAFKLLAQASAAAGNQDPQLINALAFLQATVRTPALRDGRGAEETARRIVSAMGHPDPFVLDTLAAAQAEQGRFSDAVVTLTDAITIARDEKLDGVVDLLLTRVPVYQSGKPLRQGEGPLR